jgi:hypothetical protein
LSILEAIKSYAEGFPEVPHDIPWFEPEVPCERRVEASPLSGAWGPEMGFENRRRISIPDEVLETKIDFE